MKIQRFIGDYQIEYDVLEIRDFEVIHQIKDILRLHSSEQIMLSDGRGNEATFEIADMKRAAIRCHRIGEVRTIEKPSGVTLYCALLKNENFEWVIQKTIELGVTCIVPIITARTVKLGFRGEHLARIARETAERAGRCIVPEIIEPISFEVALIQTQQNSANVFCNADGKPIADVIASIEMPIGVFIGPEGGWHEDEIRQALENKFSIVSLGHFTLRAETAAAIAVHELVKINNE